MDEVEDQLREIWAYPWFRFGVFVVAAVVAARLVEAIVPRILTAVTRRTKTELDDMVVTAVRRPLFLSVTLIGLAWGVGELELGDSETTILAIIKTLAVLVWAGAAFQIATAILATMSRRGKDSAIVQPRTVPIFEMLLKLAVVGGAVYFIFLSWDIDLTAWLASAGIIGIAIGFAAKDTLANLFAGVFIIADAPYKVGDFIVLDEGLRGQVTKIGIRSTRILTRDDVEITVPNAVIGGSKIVNETGGPHIKQRIRIPVDVAYGSDIDLVRTVLLRCPAGVSGLAEAPPPAVRFREFGGSGLRFELLVWLADPLQREAVVDELNCAIYKAFAAARIEIPFSQHDLYIRAMPEAVTRALAIAQPRS